MRPRFPPRRPPPLIFSSFFSFPLPPTYHLTSSPPPLSPAPFPIKPARGRTTEATSLTGTIYSPLVVGSCFSPALCLPSLPLLSPRPPCSPPPPPRLSSSRFYYLFFSRIVFECVISLLLVSSFVISICALLPYSLPVSVFI